MSERPTAVARWLSRLVGPLAVWMAIAALHLATRPPERWALHEASFWTEASDELRRRSLPDVWRSETRLGWYRLEVDAEHLAGDPAAVYLPTVTMNAAVSLNGTLLGDGGQFASPLPRNTNRPLLFEVPAAAISAGRNLLEIRVVTEPPGRGSLGPVFVGPVRELAPFARRSHWLRIETIWGLAVFRLAIAFFTLALWLRRRHETEYGWYAAVTVAFVLSDLNQVVVQPPVSAAAWYWFWYVSTGWLAVVTVRLITSYVGEEDRALERALWAIALAGSAALAVLAAVDEKAFHFFGGAVWLPGTFATACIAVARIRPALRRHPDDVEIEVVYGIVVTLIGAVFHDLLVDVGVLTAYSGRYAPYAAPVAIFGMGWVLLRRFFGAIHRSEAMVAGLEERVQRKRRELEEAQARIREIDRAQIAHEERDRIFREIQDGIGAKLVSTMAKIQESDASAAIAGEVVRAALDDLRLMIDSLDPLDGDLLPALAMLRSRLQPRLDAAGVRVEWQVRDLPPIPDLTPSKVLRVLRILKGAVANAVERPGAKTLVVRTGTGPDDARAVFVEIGDDGPVEWSSEAATSRMAEMSRAAREIGATLEAGPRSENAALRLTIPL